MYTQKNGGQASNIMSGFNPFAQWMQNISGLTQGQAPQLVREWEQWFSGQYEKLARNENFLTQISKSLESSFIFKQQVDRWVDASIKAMRLPGLQDVQELHGRLDALERRLDKVVDALDKVQKNQSAEIARVEALAKAALEGAEAARSGAVASTAPTEAAPEAPARKAPARKAPAKKAPARSTTKTSAAKASTAKTSTAKASAAKTSTAKASAAKASAAKTSTAKTSTAKKTPAKTETVEAATKE